MEIYPMLIHPCFDRNLPIQIPALLLQTGTERMEEREGQDKYKEDREETYVNWHDASVSVSLVVLGK